MRGGRKKFFAFPEGLEPSCCRTATFVYYADHFKRGAEAVPKRKHFARAAKPL